MSIDGNCLSSTHRKRVSTSGSSPDADNGVSRDEYDRGAPESIRPYDPFNTHYDMSGEKLLYIFNHINYLETHYPSRRGTEYDIKRLQETFGNLQFKVVDPFIDLSRNEILDQLSHICTMDHSSTSCLSIVISTHGEVGGNVLAYDRPYPIRDVINYILKEPSLAGKPKLFFIQACRGGNTDAGHRIEFDGHVGFTIPTHSDCLVVMSSFDEYVSFRGRGSWMIQDLCDVLDEHHEDRDILHMVTLLNKKVSERTSSSTKVEYNDKKQIPETRFTLTKFLKFKV